MGHPSELVVTIEDDGPGIPAADLPRLFDRFYQVDQARPRTAEAGLGLSIAQAVVDVHSGSITAERSGLGGLKITLRLPRGRYGDGGKVRSRAMESASAS